MSTRVEVDGVVIEVPDGMPVAERLEYERKELAKLHKTHPHDAYLTKLGLKPDATQEQVIAAQAVFAEKQTAAAAKLAEKASK